MKSSQPRALPSSRVVRQVALAVATAMVAAPSLAVTSSYLQDLLASTPVGGWVRGNTTSFSSAWVTDPSLKPGAADQMIYSPGAVVTAWSSMAWDSTRGNLLLWGGGHASHSGNEMYVWDGNTGAWGRGSLPSKLEIIYNWNQPTPIPYLVIDSKAPQASHTYESNLYLPVSGKFITFGAVAYNDAKNFKARDENGNIVLAGPWLWDPAKADPNKVGGSTGSGWNPGTLGGEMWTNRAGKSDWLGPNAPANFDFNFINNTTAYRTENGRDAVYITANGGGGWPNLFRYTVGDLDNGGRDTWELVGASSFTAYTFQSSGTIDDANNLYVQTTTPSNNGFDLHVWDITRSGAGNRDKGIRLVKANGDDFAINLKHGIDYSSIDGSLYIWGGDQGQVFRTQATYNQDGSLATTWIVEALGDVSASEPVGAHLYGVMGKWQYVDELGAFVALEEMNGNPALPGDAGLWFYKVADVTPVPEPASYAMLMGGLAVLGWGMRRRRSSQV